MNLQSNSFLVFFFIKNVSRVENNVKLKEKQTFVIDKTFCWVGVIDFWYGKIVIDTVNVGVGGGIALRILDGRPCGGVFDYSEVFGSRLLARRRSNLIFNSLEIALQLTVKINWTLINNKSPLLKIQVSIYFLLSFISMMIFNFLNDK